MEEETVRAVPVAAPGPVLEVSEPYTMGAPIAAEDEPGFEASDLELAKDTDAHRAAWEGRPTPRRERDDPTDLVGLSIEDEPPGGRSFLKMILVIVLGVAAGFGGFAMWAKWDKIKVLFSGARNSSEEAYYKSRTLFRLDTEAAYSQALGQLSRILSGDAKSSDKSARAAAFAAQAEIYAAWAQYLRDDARDLALQADALEEAGKAAGEGASSVPDVGPIRAQAAEKEAEAKEKALQALRSARKAIGLEASLKTRRALVEASRVAGEPPEVVSSLMEEALALGAQDPDLHYTWAMLAYEKGELDTARDRLRKAIEQAGQRTGRPFFRAQLRLGRLYLERGRPHDARLVVEAIIDRNPGHTRAALLLERLKANEKAVVVTPAAVDAGVPAPAPPDPMETMEPDGRRGVAPTEPGVGADYDALVRRADKLSFEGNQTQAIPLYHRALALRPQGVEALTGLGYALLDKRRTSDAIGHFRRALAVSGTYGEALIGMAEAQQRSGKPGEALRYYRQYLRSHPSGRRAVLARQNIRELEEKVDRSQDRPGPKDEPAMEPDRPAPRDEPVMEPDRPAPRDEPAMVPDRPLPRDEPATEPERPAPRVIEPPPAQPLRPSPPMEPATEPSRPAPRATEPRPAASAEGM